MMSMSLGVDDYDSLLHICWRRQSCGSCLADNRDNDRGVECGWCPFSSTCVPIFNPSSNQSSFSHHLHLPGILTPLHNPHICPLGGPERWDLRTATFGCAVSTMTFLTAVIGVLGTLVAIGLVWSGVKLARPGWKAWKRKRMEREQRLAVERMFRFYSGQRFVEGGGYRWRRWVRSSRSSAGDGGVWGYDGERMPLLV